MSATVKAIECVLQAYRDAGVTGTALRRKMTAAAKKYETGKKKPKKLAQIGDPELTGAVCHDYHIEGVTFFTTVAKAKESPLYKGAEELGKATPSPAFLEARRRKGQSKEAWEERVATGRVERHPGHQERQRGVIQGRQQRQRQELERLFRQSPKGKGLAGESRGRAIQPEPLPLENKGTVALISLTGRDNYADVNSNTTVRELKEELMRQEGISPEMTRMIYEGTLLEDERTIGYYGVPIVSMDDISSSLPRIHYVLILKGKSLAGGDPTSPSPAPTVPKILVETYDTLRGRLTEVLEVTPNGRLIGRGFSSDSDIGG